ncbi:MAG: NAD-dependent epimerase/dehydratase family protein, partial [bacterium]
MKVLIIGGTSFFGRHLVERFMERGDAVTVFTRGRKRPAFWERVTHLRGDRTDHGTFVQTLRTLTFDAVIDNVAFQPEDVAAAVEAFRDRIGHYVLTSTGSVYDFKRPQHFRPLTEDEADLTLRGDMEYAEGKRACEQAVHAAPFPWTVIRPPVVQGPGDPSARGWFWIQRVADGQPVLVPQREPAAVWRHAFSDDVARAMTLAAGNAAAFGKTYNVAMEEIVSLDDYVRILAAVLGTKDPVVSVPARILKREASWYHPQFAHRFVPDIAAVQRDLGFRSTPLRTWLDETTRWHLDAGLQDSYGYERRAEEVALANRLGRQ